MIQKEITIMIFVAQFVSWGQYVDDLQLLLPAFQRFLLQAPYLCDEVLVEINIVITPYLRFQITGVWVVKQIQLQFETSTRYFQRKAAKRQHVLEDIESSLDYCWTMSLWIYLGTFSDK